MRNAGAGRVKIHALFASERFDFGVLLQILRRDVLNVVIDRENRLRGVRNRRRPDLLELWHHRGGVVMRHDMTRPNRNEISGVHLRADRDSIRMPRCNFFDEGETHMNSISFP